MPTTIPCPSCGAALELGQDPATLAGDTVQCPSCHTEFPIPVGDRPRLRLRTDDATPATANTKQTCPHCHAEIAADAVLCVACGTNFQTGEHAQLARGETVSISRRIGRVAVVVISLAVIFGSLGSMYASWRQEKVALQTQTLGMMLYAANATHDFAHSIQRLESGIATNSWATNRTAAVECLARLRTELAQVPARSTALAPEITRAKALTNQLEAIALLQAAVTKNPGATNEPEALGLIGTWQQQLQQAQFRQALDAEWEKARQAKTPAESLQILQQALRRYPNAPNAPAALQALEAYQKKIAPPPTAEKP